MKTPQTSFWRRVCTVPHTYVLLVILVILAAGLTYLIPAGEFSRAKDVASGKTLIVPGSYHQVAAKPLGLLEIPVVLFKGLVDASDIIFFVFVVAGAFEIITHTNMINAFTGRLALVLRGREAWVVPIFLSVFSIGGFTMGMSAEVLVFVPIGIIMARSLGYDVVTGTAMVVLGAGVGYTAGLMNPFSVGIAQAIAQLPLFSGMWLRVLMLVVLLLVTSAYILRYANRVKADPSRSVVAGVPDLVTDFDQKDAALPELKPFHFGVLAVVVAGFALLFWGVSAKNWWINEMAATFMMIGVFSGFVAGYGPSKVANCFVAGARSVTFGALIIGFARAIFVVMQDAKIVDTIVNNLAVWVSVLPHTVQLLGMYVVQTIVSLIIGSSSGQAVVTMPIMVPLSDLLGISRQTAVLIFQCPDGFTNSILPTSAATMGALSVAKIPFERWFKFMLPLELIWLLIGALFAVLASMIGYQ
ncbi:MAG TPA: Na+/H+ antiporter NhaC family protein [Selenomonadales bacterium]|nr:Na+/H+ antiporter NhaC family protein [Selenomonadales bacterium]